MQIKTALAVRQAEELIAQESSATNLEVVALAPADLLAAQTDLVNWCDAKTKELHAELNELRENLRIAKENKWRHSGLQNAVTRTERRLAYYDKIKLAIAAGYLIVPNFQVDVFAVRVERERPRATVYNSRWARHEAAAEQLPAGEGRYVGLKTIQRDESYQRSNGKGGTEDVICLIDEGFTDVVFPVQAVKPVVMDATQRAMALRIFDQVGLVHNRGSIASARRGDPIVVGQLRDPRGTGRGVTFFIAWWLNTGAL